MTAKLIQVTMWTLILMLTGGCGQVNEESFDALEQQRSDVIAWSRDLSSTTNRVLESRAEDSTGAYVGVDKRGLSAKYESYNYDVRATFRSTQADPVVELTAAFADYDPEVDPNGSVRLVNGDLVAVFQAPSTAEGRVAFTASGPAIEIAQEEMMDWDGRITSESVDLN